MHVPRSRWKQQIDRGILSGSTLFVVLEFNERYIVALTSEQDNAGMMPISKRYRSFHDALERATRLQQYAMEQFDVMLNISSRKITVFVWQTDFYGMFSAN